MTVTTFFLQFSGETKKVTADEHTIADLYSLFRSKFEDAGDVSNSSISFEMKDKDYDVVAKLENTADIYDGAVVTAKLVEPSSEKRKLSSLSDGDNLSAGGPSKRHMSAVRPAGERYIVRIRGVPWECGERDVEEFFSDVQILDNGINMITTPAGQHRGEALVEFPNQDELDKALKKDREHIRSRYIEIYRATAGEADRLLLGKEVAGGTAGESGQTIPISASSLVVKLRGLPWRATESDVVGFLADVSCVAVHFPVDNLGRSSGDAFVELSDEESVRNALAYDKKYLGNRFIDVFRSDVPALREAMGVNAAGQKVPTYGTETSIRIQGLPYGSTEQDITNFFRDVKAEPYRIHRKQDGSEAYVEFHTAEDANRAMTKNKAYMGRRYLELFRIDYNQMAAEVGLPPRPTYPYAGYPPPAPYGGGRGMYGGYPAPSPYGDPSYSGSYGGAYSGGFSGGYGSPPAYPPSYGYGAQPPPPSGGSTYGGSTYGGGSGVSYGSPSSPAPTRSGTGVPTTVSLKGLPWSCTVDQIADFFRGHEIDPSSIHINLNEEGRPAGTGSVSFLSRPSAEQAVQMLNRKYIENRYIELTLSE